MYQSSYDGAAGKSSSGDKDKFRAGSRDAYAKDMYDMMPKFESKKVTTEPNTGIQGSEGSRDTLDGPKSGMGNTGDKTQKIAVKSNDGSKDYGKGNPYKKKTITSIDQLRKMGNK